MRERYPSLPDSLRSTYIRDTLRQEDTTLQDIVFDDELRTITGRLAFDGREQAGGRLTDGHLSAFSAAVAVSELAIAYCCQAEGKTKYELGEVLERDFSIHSSRMVSTSEPVPIAVRLERLKPFATRRYAGTYWSFAYSINDGAMTGRLALVTPRMNAPPGDDKHQDSG